ncbi:MAG: MBL fold metallo-hydrolase [bacterium]|nr:MBL fold metallo-hydrolase [bacterium]
MKLPGRASLPRLVALLLLGAGGLLAVWVGWLSPVRDWRAATGWDEIPASQRPTATELWRDPAAGPPPELRWLGHSGFVLRWHGETILIDPNVSRRCTVSKRLMETPADLAALGPVSAVLISHAHYDHLDMPTLEAARRLDAVVLPAGSEGYFSDPRWRATRLVPLAVGQRWRLGELEIIAVHADHNGNRFHPLKSRRLAVGYVIASPEAVLYYAGDTGFGDHLERIGKQYRPRAAILPIGAYTPRFPLAYYHLNPEEAADAARVLGVETVVPCHFGTYVLSLDRPSWALPRFARAAHDRQVRWLMPPLWQVEEREPMRAGLGSPGGRG